MKAILTATVIAGAMAILNVLVACSSVVGG